MRVCVGESPVVGVPGGKTACVPGTGQKGRWAGVVGGRSEAGLGLGSNPQAGGVLNVRKDTPRVWWESPQLPTQ